MVTIDRVDLRRAAVCSLMCSAVACGDRGKAGGLAGGATAEASARASTAAPLVASASAAASFDAPAPSASVVTSSSAAPASSASASAVANDRAAATSTGTGEHDCKLARGPVRLGTTGAIAIGPGEGGLLAFATNKVGAPSWEVPRFPEPPKVGPTSLLPKPPSGPPAVTLSPSSPPGDPSSAAADASPERTRLPACALAAGLAFCVDAEGQIHRRRAQGDDDKVIAKGRRGTPVSAVALGGHTFYAFLANQKTTEGTIVRAFVGLDDETPIPLSEDGSGATSLGLVAREKDVLAMYIDARTALTPVHARTLRVEGALVRGPDAVVLVGGGADGVIRGALGRAASGPAFLIVPSSPDDREYGLITIPIEGDPKDDMKGKWSMFPAPMSSPPLAVTTGVSPLRLVRGRPETKEAEGPRVLELGHVDPDGTFRERCVLAKSGSFTDVSVAVDDQDNLWIAYTNASGTWVEQRGRQGK